VSTFAPPIRRIETARGHHYVDANRQRVPGVTTILSGGMPKPALINWAANSTAEYAVDNWAALSGLTPSERLKKLQGARYEVRDAAANRGTQIQPLARGEEVDVPDDIAGHVESCVQFLDEFRPDPVLLEATVYSLKYGHAGTLDAVFDFPNGLRGFPQPAPRILIDWKSNRTGVYGESAYQLAAYRCSEFMLDEAGNGQPMIPVDGCAVVHLKADGFDLIPMTAGPVQYREFLYIAQVRRVTDESRDLVGNPIPPPSRVQRRRLEIVTPQLEAAS
jgi:hypothetical protein